MPLQKIIPAYLYQQYADDADLQAFFREYNLRAQEYLDFVNALNLGIYSDKTGTLLDWIAQGVYGVPRPQLAMGAVTDDIFHRYLMWLLYRGDGRQMSIRWLKNRVQRFVNGGITSPMDTNNVSLTFVHRQSTQGLYGSSFFNTTEYNQSAVSVDISGVNADVVIRYATHDVNFNLLADLYSAGLLGLPFQYNFVFVKN